MDPLGRGQRWLRERKARRLLGTARHSRAGDVDVAVVEDLGELVGMADDAGRMAVEALEAIARSPDPAPARDAATDVLVDVLGRADPGMAASAARSLRYVAISRPGVAGRLDEGYAGILRDHRHDAHREVALDAGMVLSRADDAGDALPETRETLRETLVGGPDPARRTAAVAYVVAADRPAAFEHHASIAEGLAIVGSRTDDPVPAPGSTARQLSGGRTLRAAVEAFRDAAREP